MAHQWYFKSEAKEHGPFSSAQLKKFAEEGRITPDSQIRRGEVGKWVHASKVKGLFPATESPWQAAEESETPQVEDRPIVAPELKRDTPALRILKSRKYVWGGIAAAALLLMLVISYAVFSGGDSQTTDTEATPTQVSPDLGTVRRPGVLGAGLLTLSTPELDKVRKRIDKVDKNTLQQGLDAWTDALKSVASGDLDSGDSATALVMFLPQLDKCWVDDRFQVEVFQEYITKLKALRPDTVEKWEAALNTALKPLGTSTDKLETIGFLIQMDRLFNGDDFTEEESQTLLARVGSINPNAVKSLADTINSYISQAAVILIQVDGVFDQNRFRQPLFDEALRKISQTSASPPEKTAAATPERRRSLPKFYEEIRRYLKNAANEYPQTGYDFLAMGGEVPKTWEVMRLFGGQVEWEGVFEGFDDGSKLDGRAHKVKVKGPPGRTPMLHVYPSADSVKQWQALATNSKVRFRATIEGIAAFAVPAKSGENLVIVIVSLIDAAPLAGK